MCNLLVKAWQSTTGEKGYLTPHDFNQMVLPHDNPQLRAAVTQRPQMTVFKIDNATEAAFFEVLRVELELQSAANSLKLQLESQDGFSTSSLFKALDRRNVKFLDWELLLQFM